ncbi:MAG: carcinine hydrolase/isopenicillin-N N-acyltransferase family protein [Bacteroidales bacterium]
MKRLFVLLLLLAGAGMTGDIWSCTTFIISGKNTPDGKPILYKNRDTGTLDNAIVFFSDGKYQFIGVVDSRESWKQEVWGGFNSAGFAIMNSAAYNNNVGDASKFADQEGVVMKLALASCATLADFEKMLTDLPKPLGVDANFGVIDASGGAAYYETGNYGFKKIDANDPALAPYGYLIRTNHSFTGTVDVGGGYIRYAAASEALNMAAAQKKIEPQYLLNNISRNLNHSLTKVNLRADLPGDNKSAEFRSFEDFIPRFSTASVIMVVGAAKGEDPSASMAWMVAGSPLTAVAVPVWVSAGKKLPWVVSMKDDMHAPLCDAAMQLKGQLFPISRGNGSKYINVAALINDDNTGILQRLEPVENEIFKKTAEMMTAMKGNKSDKELKLEHYKWIDSYIIQSYKEQFGIEIK